MSYMYKVTDLEKQKSKSMTTQAPLKSRGPSGGKGLGRLFREGDLTKRGICRAWLIR